ncbi:Snf7-domain-containing protein [Amylocarpus encephaloides]|uniref:Snf7-domain-containing protein n=1 Tax=Amylocarpus encephaloides TaxID=45428 RepID=A0A9P7YHQ4_9HELO|nr:Snf7-domain-containing protein [Amylocarpus encephaloides]
MSELVTYLQNNEPQFRKNRLAALYSDFRPLCTLNPDGYNANIDAWLKALKSATLAGAVPSSSSTHNLLSLNVDESLLRALNTKEWGRPLALGTVVREAVERKEMVGLREFEVSEGFYNQRRGWGINPWSVLGWGFRMLGLGGGVNGEDKLPVGNFVVVPNLEEAGYGAAARMEGIRGRTEKVFSRTEFKERFGDVLGEGKALSESDFVVLLRFLERDKALLVYDGETVKLRVLGDSTGITQEDATIVSLRTLIKDIEVQIGALTKRLDELMTTAKAAVERKNKVAALAALRSKKLAESTLTKRHATLAQLEEVFTKIEQAADQVDLVRVMEASTRVLTGLNKEVGGVERVDDVVDQLREQMSQVDEVGNVIAEVGQDTNPVDDSEVDDELEAMERQEREKIEEKERKEREEREKKEAAETQKKLDALEEVEGEAANAKHREDLNKDTDLEDSIEKMKRVSLELQ